MFTIILFKNNKKRKKIKQFVRESIAINFYENLLKKSKNIKFSKHFESGSPCKFDLAIISDSFTNEKIFYTDEFGRNKIVEPKIDDNNYIIRISSYNIEEEIHDIKNDKRISIDEFLSKIPKDKVSMISQIKNKFVLQNDENYELYSLKNSDDCDRLLDIIMSLDIKNKPIIVKDISSPQRKYLYKLLENNGFSKKSLYTSYTTYPK
jgi:hypothetical protein